MAMSITKFVQQQYGDTIASNIYLNCDWAVLHVRSYRVQWRAAAAATCSCLSAFVDTGFCSLLQFAVNFSWMHHWASVSILSIHFSGSTVHSTNIHCVKGAILQTVCLICKEISLCVVKTFYVYRMTSQSFIVMTSPI